MDFFICSHAAPHVAALDDDPALDESHWSYMDRFADGMIARGPLLTPDREGWLGSMHIVDLPSVDAAREFVEREPYNRAGACERHLIRRFENRLGRTMWAFPGVADEPRFLAVAQSATATPTRLVPERLIVHGDLSEPVDGTPAGAVWALQAPTHDAVEALFEGEVEIFAWEFGGRR